MSQKHCFNIIVMTVVDDLQHAHFFLQSSADTDKIFLYCTLCNYYWAMSKIIMCVISFNIAALLLLSNQTLHFCFKISLKLHEFSVCFINKNTQLANLLQNTVLIIWNEMFMQHKYCFKVMHCTLQTVLSIKNHVFNEISTVLKRNFAHILLIIQRENIFIIVNVCI